MTLTRNNLTVIISTVLMLLTTKSQAYVQQDTSDSKPNLSWLNLGLGVGSIGLSAGASFSYNFGSSLISIRSVANSEFKIFGPSPSENVWDLGVLYGRSAKASYGVASISGGIAIVGGVRRGRYLGSTGGFFSSDKYESLTFSTIGIPIEGQLFWTPFSFFGIGIYGFGNLNPEQSFAGALLCLEFGEVR